MREHRGRVDPPVLGARETRDRRERRKRLESELAHELRNLLAERLERLAVVPHAPVMRISLREAPRIGPAVARRRGPVGPLAVAAPHYPREKLVEELLVVAPYPRRIGRRVSVLALPAPVMPRLVDLVVAAPEGEARMVPQALDDCRSASCLDVVPGTRNPPDTSRRRT